MGVKHLFSHKELPVEHRGPPRFGATNARRPVGRFCAKRCGPSRRRVRDASAALKNFRSRAKKDFFNIISQKPKSWRFEAMLALARSAASSDRPKFRSSFGAPKGAADMTVRVRLGVMRCCTGMSSTHGEPLSVQRSAPIASRPGGIATANGCFAATQPDNSCSATSHGTLSRQSDSLGSPLDIAHRARRASTSPPAVPARSFAGRAERSS